MASFDSPGSPQDVQAKRRALVIGGPSAETLRQQLGDSGYHTDATRTSLASGVIADFAPDVVLIVLEKTDVDGEAVALARHLRELPATHAVPLVLVYVEDER
jgi:CheY-like chemotaxis protein